jgi:hypothetical protein
MITACRAVCVWGSDHLITDHGRSGGHGALVASRYHDSQTRARRQTNLQKSVTTLPVRPHVEDRFQALCVAA